MRHTSPLESSLAAGKGALEDRTGGEAPPARYLCKTPSRIVSANPNDNDEAGGAAQGLRQRSDEVAALGMNSPAWQGSESLTDRLKDRSGPRLMMRKTGSASLSPSNNPGAGGDSERFLRVPSLGFPQRGSTPSGSAGRAQRDTTFKRRSSSIVHAGIDAGEPPRCVAPLLVGAAPREELEEGGAAETRDTPPSMSRSAARLMAHNSLLLDMLESPPTQDRRPLPVHAGVPENRFIEPLNDIGRVPTVGSSKSKSSLPVTLPRGAPLTRAQSFFQKGTTQPAMMFCLGTTRSLLAVVNMADVVKEEGADTPPLPSSGLGSRQRRSSLFGLPTAKALHSKIRRTSVSSGVHLADFRVPQRSGRRGSIFGRTGSIIELITPKARPQDTAASVCSTKSDSGVHQVEKGVERMTTQDAAILAGKVECASTVEELMALLKAYTPPRFNDQKHDQKSARKAPRLDTEEEEANETTETPAQARAGKMLKWLLFKTSVILASVVTELITFIAWQIVWPDDFLCEADADGLQSPHVSNVAILCFVMSVHLYRTISGWVKILGQLGLLPRWVSSVGGQRHFALTDLIPLWGFTTCIPLTFYIMDVSINTCILDPVPGTPGISRSPLERLHVAVHFTRVLLVFYSLFSLRNEVRHLMQAAVSGNRRRFIDSRFDLDLTYIADRLIAMALPCIAGASYRNDIHVVSRFFTHRHYGCFQIFNLCEPQEEAGNGNYDAHLFYKQVCKVTQRDHNICSLQTLVNFAKQAVAFLNLDQRNIVAIHCRGGKGRTGSFCATVLLWSGFSRTAAQALAYFASRRTDLKQGTGTVQGVAAPSQIRYVHYIEAVRYLNFDFVSPRHLLLTKVTLHGVPRLDLGGCQVTFIVESSQGIVYDHAKSHGLMSCQPPNHMFNFPMGHLPIVHDVAVRFFYFDSAVCPDTVKGCVSQLMPGGMSIQYHTPKGETVVGRQLIFAQFHTAFHNGPSISFERNEIDGAYNTKTSRFASNFSMDLSVTDLPTHQTSQQVLRAMMQVNSLLHTTNKSPLANTHHALNEGVEEIDEEEIDEERTSSGNPADDLLQRVTTEHSISGPKRQGSVRNVVKVNGFSGGGMPSRVGRQTMWSGRRHLEMSSRLEELFARAGATQEVYCKGETVRSPEESDGKERCLMLVTKGNVAVYASAVLEWAVSTCYNPGAHRGIILRGRGDMVGVQDFMLGTGEDLAAHVVAMTEEVRCLKLRIDHQTYHQPPLFTDRLPPQEANEFYEMVARFICGLAVRVDKLVQAKHQTMVKHDVWASSEEETRLVTVRRLRIKFKIPLSLPCAKVALCGKMAEGKVESPSFASTDALFGHRSRLFCFPDCIYVVTRTDDLRYRIADIQECTSAGRYLTLTMRPQDPPLLPAVRRASVANSKRGRQVPRNNWSPNSSELPSSQPSYTSPEHQVSPAAYERRRWGSIDSREPQNLSGRGSQGVSDVKLRWHFVQSSVLGGRKPGSWRGSWRGETFVGSNSGGEIKEEEGFGKSFLVRRKAAKDAPRSNLLTQLDLFDIETAVATRDCILKQMKDLATEVLGLDLVKMPAHSPSEVLPGKDKDSEADGVTTSEEGISSQDVISLGDLGSTPSADTITNRISAWVVASEAARETAIRAAMRVEEAHAKEAHMDNDLRELLNSVPITVMRDGEVILRAGELSRSIFIIVSGSVVVRSHTGEILVRREAGEVVGEVAYYSFGNGGASCDAVASCGEETGLTRLVEATSIRVMSGDTLDRWRVEDPMKAALINRFLARCMSERVRKQVQDAVMFLDA